MLKFILFGLGALAIILMARQIYFTSNAVNPLSLEYSAPAINKMYIIAAVGDLACAPLATPTARSCRTTEVVDGIRKIKPDNVLLLGDLQYEKGEKIAFEQVFDKLWLPLKSITYPSLGNHEYGTGQAIGYFDYWSKDSAIASQAESESKGYYSFNVGKWHMVSLNSNCEYIGGCGADSEQGKWLAEDLAKSESHCTLAFWHHPLFTSGRYKQDIVTRNRSNYFWTTLESKGADVILNGHDHLYERFARQRSDGTKDDVRGIRQFTVGNGGKSLYSFSLPYIANHEAGFDESFGFLQLELLETAYRWKFIDIAGEVRDSGYDSCI